jgi:hypothetical protein
MDYAMLKSMDQYDENGIPRSSSFVKTWSEDADAREEIRQHKSSVRKRWLTQAAGSWHSGNEFPVEANAGARDNLFGKEVVGGARNWDTTPGETSKGGAALSEQDDHSMMDSPGTLSTEGEDVCPSRGISVVCAHSCESVCKLEDMEVFSRR